MTKTSRNISKGSRSGLIAMALLWATPGWAAVIEIAPDGEAVTYVAPAVFTAEGARPIGPALSARPISRTAGDVAAAIANASTRHAVSPHLIEAVAWRESRFRQSASSSAGAVGVMQLMAGTARDLGVDRYDLDQNVSGGAAYLRAMLQRYGGDLTLALAAYNAGPGAVDRYGGVPPYRETQAYVAAILSRLSDQALSASPVNLAGR